VRLGGRHAGPVFGCRGRTLFSCRRATGVPVRCYDAELQQCDSHFARMSCGARFGLPTQLGTVIRPEAEENQVRWIRINSASNGQPHWINLEHFLDMRIVAYEDAQKRRLAKDALVYRHDLHRGPGAARRNSEQARHRPPNPLTHHATRNRDPLGLRLLMARDLH